MKGKRVAVIGAGSSAIQIMPHAQKVAAHVDQFVKNTTWITPVRLRRGVRDLLISQSFSVWRSGTAFLLSRTLPWKASSPRTLNA
jgi:cation diffusion facilitator CzcD-associated flavoprotein CzcO